VTVAPPRNPTRAKAGLQVSAAALALATALIATHEGEVRHTYRDPVGIATACFGETRGVTWGKTYSHAECLDMLKVSALAHAEGVQACLPQLPDETAAAFYDLGYNIGATKFCASGVARKARAGDLKGACADLSKWVYAGGRVLPGLVKRRKAERELCERGLR
jgi:lysozyme